MIDLHKTPFPYFGGKSAAATIVWDALGDVDHYVEPFAGSLAVLLRRPHTCNRPYHSETVNDADGLLVNAWRSIQFSPDATADAASWPVSEADLMARHIRLLRWRKENDLERLMADPVWHDPVMGGWWIWGMSSWIGGGWTDGSGPWVVGSDGRITRRPDQREPGVNRRIPQLTDGGRGVNRPGSREPGVNRRRPTLSHGGRGVNRPGSREPGVQQATGGPASVGGDPEFHPMTMPEVRRWFEFLAARLRHVRILNGDWTRATTSGVCKILNVRMNDGHAGVFLDPPYSDVAGRDGNLYAIDCKSVANSVRTWCLANGDDRQLRIVLAGFDVEHVELERHGWRVVDWFKGGFLTGGMGNQAGKGNHQQHRERLWLSPHCQVPARQQSLFTG